jgi:hypothetical protein
VRLSSAIAAAKKAHSVGEGIWRTILYRSGRTGARGR